MNVIDRRATPRLEVLDQIHGQIVSLDVPLTLRELGTGGFSIESLVRFPPGARHRFRFTTADGVEIILDATVIHSGRTSPSGSVTRYITGFSFVHDSAEETWKAVDTLIDSMVAVLHPG